MVIETYIEDIDVIYVGAVGVKLLFKFEKRDGSAFDISTATEKKCRIKRADGTVIEKSLTFETNGINGEAYYVTAGADINSEGRYMAEGYVKFNAGLESPSLPVRFRAISRIPSP